MCSKVCLIIVSIFVVIGAIGIGIYVTLATLMSYSEKEKCPFCYGNTVCDAFQEEEITTNKLKLMFNFIGEKNVFFGDYHNVDVVMKKLASTEELRQFDNELCHEYNLNDTCDLSRLDGEQNYTHKIMEHMTDNVPLFKHFKVCSKSAAEMLLEYFLKMRPQGIDEETYLKNVWTILKINAEPLILQLLKSEENWPVPKYYGSCGRFAVMENRGAPLLEKTDLPWIDRAYLALQLLYSAKNFTFDHPHLRFYLTDISPDNIAVDDTLKLTIIDLEDVVVFHEKINTNTHHKSPVIPDPKGFAFIQDDMCSHSVSDHNYYAICKLLLSRNAPDPMVKNGLLHTPPVHIIYNYPHLFDLIEECSDAKNFTDRFETGKSIINILNEILSDKEKYKNATVIVLKT